jgi:hypothetical protein
MSLSGTRRTAGLPPGPRRRPLAGWRRPFSGKGHGPAAGTGHDRDMTVTLAKLRRRGGTRGAIVMFLTWTVGWARGGRPPPDHAPGALL